MKFLSKCDRIVHFVFDINSSVCPAPDAPHTPSNPPSPLKHAQTRAHMVYHHRHPCCNAFCLSSSFCFAFYFPLSSRSSVLAAFYSMLCANAHRHTHTHTHTQINTHTQTNTSGVPSSPSVLLSPCSFWE
jgi:hypothetical protein